MKNEGQLKRKSRKFFVRAFFFFFLILLINCGSGNEPVKNEENNFTSNMENGGNIKKNSIDNEEKKNKINTTRSYKNVDSQTDKQGGEYEYYKSVIFDAGSTGTRVHIYSYKIIEDEEINEEIKIFIPSINFKMTPGLVYLLNKYFENDKEEFELYFKKIKSFLSEHVKEKERSSTPIIFRASGGFRLLSVNLSNQYINFLKKYFYEHFFEYLLIDDFFIKVLSGKEEAILSFVSINALLKNFSQNPLVFPHTEENEKNVYFTETDNVMKNIEIERTDNNKKKSITRNKKEKIDDSTAIVEIGGASAQIVVQLPLSKINEDISNSFNYKSKQKGDHFIKENYKKRNIVKIRLFHKDMFLYCKSYLVLGRQNVMKTYLHYVVHNINKKKEKVKKFVPVACFPKNFKFHIDKLFITSIEEDICEYNKNRILGINEYIGVGTGDIEECRKEMQAVLNHSKIENLPFKLKKYMKIYAIENFHHFVTDILNIPDKYNPLLIDTSMYLKKAEQLCPSTIEEIIKLINPKANLEKAQTSCFGLVFLYEFLRYIFQIDESIQIYSSNYVNNVSITWTIAVMIMEIPAYFDLIKKQKEKEKYKNYYQDEL